MSASWIKSKWSDKDKSSWAYHNQTFWNEILHLQENKSSCEGIFMIVVSTTMEIRVSYVQYDHILRSTLTSLRLCKRSGFYFAKFCLFWYFKMLKISPTVLKRILVLEVLQTAKIVHLSYSFLPKKGARK